MIWIDLIVNDGVPVLCPSIGPNIVPLLAPLEIQSCSEKRTDGVSDHILLNTFLICVNQVG